MLRLKIGLLAFCLSSYAWIGTAAACLEDMPAADGEARTGRAMRTDLDFRTDLAARGVAIGGSYAGDLFANVAGGLDETVTYGGLLDVFLDADLDRLAGWRGLCFHANVFQIHGESVTAEGTGTLAPASSAEAEPAARLSEIWLEQSLLEGRASVRFGQLAADTEFMATRAIDYFLNATWGWPTITAFDIPDGGPAYPMAAPGLRLRVRPKEHLDFKLALFNGRVAEPCVDEDPQLCNPHGLQFPLGDPPLVMGEMALRYALASRLPGELKLGGWHHFGDFEDLRFDAGGNLIAVTGLRGAPRDGNHGLYAVLDQTIWQPDDASDDTGIAIFARLMGAPHDRNVVDVYAEFGVIFHGMIAARPDDALAAGFEYTSVSKRARAFDVDTGAEVASVHESLAEVTYTLSLRENWTLQAGLQYFFRHGGGHGARPADGALENSVVIGTRSTWTF